MKLLHITDLHLQGRADALADRRLENCVSHLCKNHADAELCLVTGDISEDGTEAGYITASKKLSRLPCPFYAILGNHDHRETARIALPNLTWDKNGFCQAILETSEYSIILLDTLDMGKHGGTLCIDRLNWVAEALHSTQNRPVILAMHHAPFQTGLLGMDDYGLSEGSSRSLAALLSAHGRIRHLFFGHYHRQISGCWQGIPFSSLPSFSKQCALALSESGQVPMTDGPACYAVVLLTDTLTVVHSEALPEP